MTARALVLVTAGAVFAQTAPRPAQPVPQAVKPSPQAVAKLRAAADAARAAERVDEAVELYRQALAADAKWAEGWWQVGTIEYARDHYPACRDAFRQFTLLETKAGPGFAFLGLCEFQTKELAPATKHLETAVSLGLPQGEQLTDVVLYHLALLHTKGGNFERALQLCSMLVKRSVEADKLAAVAGLAALRRPMFPHELPQEDRDLTLRLGQALLSAGVKPAEEVIAAFEDLLRQYPSAPSAHYTYATFLLANAPDRGLEELKKELAISPNHLPALVSAAFEHLRRGEPELARPLAERAARIAPGSFAARACLGRVLLELDESQLAAAIRELEAAVKLAPDSPQVHFSLASAYTKAGRKQEAVREREEFARLKKLQPTTAP